MRPIQMQPQRKLVKVSSCMKLAMSDLLLMFPVVNAYYSPPDGEIVFPAGILRSPFFSSEWPLYLQYGAFGSVAAHELSHAFGKHQMKRVSSPISDSS